MISYLLLWGKWFCFLAINLITNLLALPLTPIVVLFASKTGWLPWYLWYFQTPDNSLDGDSGWKVTHPASTYWNRVRWLWRNRLYGFSAAVLRVIYDPTVGDYLTLTGDRDIGNSGPLAKSGHYFKLLYTKKSKIKGFEWYYIRRYKHWPNKCIRILIGWKLPEPNDTPVYTKCTFGFSPSPWMHFGN